MRAVRQNPDQMQPAFTMDRMGRREILATTAQSTSQK